MDLYVLDNDLRRVDIFDAYSSMVWAERVLPHGEFELETADTPRAREVFRVGRMLAIQKSNRVMIVESVSVMNKDEERKLRVLGRSAERWFEDRVAAPGILPTADAEGNEVLWKFSGTPQQTIREIAKKSLILDQTDAQSHILPITDTTYGSILVTETAEFQIKPNQADKLMNDIAEVYSIGWRLVRFEDGSALDFQVFTGDDRTTGQTVFSPVVFSEELGNLTNVNTIESSKEYKNVAYVFGKKASAIVYADNVDPAITGNERRVLYVDASDLDDDIQPGPELEKALRRKGLDELAKRRPVLAFDGEADKYSGYVYGQDYNLGDRVEFRDQFGNRNTMIVTEQVFIVDGEGARSYPTLSYHDITIVGSWAAYNPTQVWSDIPNDANHEWADLP